MLKICISPIGTGTERDAEGEDEEDAAAIGGRRGTRYMGESSAKEREYLKVGLHECFCLCIEVTH